MEDANQVNHTKKKKKHQSPEGQFRLELDTCSKNKDLSGAISLYKTAVLQIIRLNHYHYNALLYVYSSSKDSALEYGFRIFDHMLASGINPTEATITAVARLAAAKGDADLAFELVKNMGKYKISPRLRSYDTALFAFCQRLEADKAYSVEDSMVSMGVHPEEPELAALLKVSSEAGREEKVYSYLQKLRNYARCVNASTAEIIERWFCSSLASVVDSSNWDAGRVKDVILKNGGGWHGQGCLGKGKWVVCRSNIDSKGLCQSCGEQLVCVDIDRSETEKFVQSIASLAMKREVKSNFRDFQDWLDNHAEYEAVVDGANVGLYQQNFADGRFSLSQLDAVVRELYERSQKKWPLVILHNKRFQSLLENPSNQKMLEEWKARGALYTMPNGSNDDWYWLYAAVKCKCLLVTNDEMRDHIFELLGSNFFLRWKERHQVRYTFMKCNLRLQMPPSYSLVIQESEIGSWHVPLEGECNNETLRIWLCITRPRSCGHPAEVLANLEAPEADQPPYNISFSLYKPETSTTDNGLEGNPISFPLSENKITAVTGKRKEKNKSPSNLKQHP
ncbi:hypothetical protein HHK36_000925 [Tetracentron sinense]|uniref:ribonuclease P n=1 Tax=Tetracentron sinense TaxID=13715 RepID=A0A835DRK4_TETSI|nr:hypothetical protein HHK36_000925 [Tetracentron sinense]